MFDSIISAKRNPSGIPWSLGYEALQPHRAIFIAAFVSTLGQITHLYWATNVSCMRLSTRFAFISARSRAAHAKGANLGMCSQDYKVKLLLFRRQDPVTTCNAHAITPASHLDPTHDRLPGSQLDHCTFPQTDLPLSPLKRIGIFR